MHSSTAPTLLGVCRALPAHYTDQTALTAVLQRKWAGTPLASRLEPLHRSVRVRGRTHALPIEAYDELGSFAASNEAWSRASLDLGARALEGALERADLQPRAIDHLFFVSSTGIATPGVDARLFNRLGLRGDAKRTPIFGLGCAGGAAGLARAADWARAFPGAVAAVVAAEICTVTFQQGDRSVGNAIAAGLFADGAAAAILGGPDQARAGLPAVVATGSSLYPDTERVMGWDVVETGLQVNLSADVPAVVGGNIRQDVERFLGAQGLSLSSIRHWICHPGGPRVIEAIQGALDLPDTALARSWRTLESLGNLSSVSVLLVLEETLAEVDPRQGDYGLVLAMGPGFSSELVLLRW